MTKQATKIKEDGHRRRDSDEQVQKAPLTHQHFIDEAIFSLVSIPFFKLISLIPVISASFFTLAESKKCGYLTSLFKTKPPASEAYD